MKTMIGMGVIGAMASVSLGQVYAGDGGAIPDDGGPSDPLVSRIFVSDTGVLTDLDLNLDITHSWVGDLIITLTHENSGTSVLLADRTGLGDNTLAGFGWNLEGAYTFDDDAPTYWADFGNPGSAFVLDNGSYQGVEALSAFNGEDVSGFWTLRISDNAFLDDGSLAGWSISATVPAPASALILGFGGAMASRRRRG